MIINATAGNAGSIIAHTIALNANNIGHQLHGSAKCFKHHANLFGQFAEQELPFMLLKVMATPRRDCRVPAQAEFFATKEELEAKFLTYWRKEVREDGLDVLFVDMFEWDLGINWLPPIEPN